MKIKITTPFFETIAEVEMPSAPAIGESLTLLVKNKIIEYDIKAVNHVFDRNNHFQYSEVCVEESLANPLD